MMEGSTLSSWNVWLVVLLCQLCFFQGRSFWLVGWLFFMYWDLLETNEFCLELTTVFRYLIGRMMVRIGMSNVCLISDCTSLSASAFSWPSLLVEMKDGAKHVITWFDSLLLWNVNAFPFPFLLFISYFVADLLVSCRYNWFSPLLVIKVA